MEMYDEVLNILKDEVWRKTGMTHKKGLQNRMTRRKKYECPALAILLFVGFSTIALLYYCATVY